MREIAVCLFNSMKEAGVNPNLVSFGQCMKVSSDSKESIAKDYWSPGSVGRKRFRRLEDNGWRWCQTRVPCLGGTMPGSSAVGPRPGLVVTEPLYKERMGIGNNLISMDFFASTPTAGSLDGSGGIGGAGGAGGAGGSMGGDEAEVGAGANGEARGESKGEDESAALVRQDPVGDSRASPTEDGSDGTEGLFGASCLDMWTENVCPSCRRPLLDEEVMASWRDGTADARIEDCRVTVSYDSRPHTLARHSASNPITPPPPPPGSAHLAAPNGTRKYASVKTSRSDTLAMMVKSHACRISTSRCCLEV